jgi:hypothetical protein
MRSKDRHSREHQDQGLCNPAGAGCLPGETFDMVRVRLSNSTSRIAVF